jgi:cell division protein FtsQ
MAEDYMYSGEAADTGRARGRYDKVLKGLIAAACFAVSAELIWLLGITPFMPFSRIDISPVKGLARDHVLALAGIGAQSSFISVDAKAAEKTLRALPQIESARVFKHFPSGLEIILEGRRAAALALAGVNGKMVPVLFDSSGVIFQVGNGTYAEVPAELPVISGLVIENPAPGMRLPAMFGSLFSALESISLKAPELLAAVSEIRVSRRSFDGFDVILYPVHRQIRVRLSEVNEDLLRYTLLMVDVLAAKEPGISEVDFRAGMASYTPKEASSEQ